MLITYTLLFFFFVFIPLGSIIIVGTVFALAAQILAIIFTLLRNR